MTVSGLDVSKYNGSIDWAKVAASGRAFTFLRSSDGLYVDPIFAHNFDGAKAAGIMRGAYHFFRSGLDPIKQARVLVDALGGSVTLGDLPPVVDVETMNGHAPADLPHNLDAFITELELLLGCTPIVYTSPGFWNQLPASALDGDLPLWVADWYVEAPTLPRGFHRYDFWQSTNRALIPGINGPDDGDVWNGTIESLRTFAATAHGTLPPPPIPPIPNPPEPPMPSTVPFKLCDNQQARKDGPRATELLTLWRQDGGLVGHYDADPDGANWGTHSDEIEGPLEIRYSYENHPPDSINSVPHTGVTIYERPAPVAETDPAPPPDEPPAAA